jgi:RimK family alpha-L-glutamate ligase
VVAEDVKHALAAIDLLDGDVVVKPVYGGQGTGIFRITNKGFGERVFMEMFQQGIVFYIQEYHPTASIPGFDTVGPFDVRVFVVGGRAIGAMLRASPDPEAWRTNIHQGAVPIAFEPDPEVADLAVQAASVMGLEIAGVDLLYSAKASGWIVLEVNSCPGWTGLSRVSEVDYPGEIAALFSERLDTWI